jgi:hypothetical protein
MPNFTGANQFRRENPQGAVKKLTQLTKSAPMSGAPTPAVTAPDRAQAHAVRGRQPQQAAAAPVQVPPPAGPPPYEAQLASVWAEIAREIPHPLVADYANRAAARPA